MFGLMNITLFSPHKKTHNTVFLLLQQDTETLVHNSDLINLIPCELNLTSTTVCYKTIPTYEIELPTYGNKTVLNLLYDKDFTTPYITYTITNLPEFHQLPTQAKRNVWIIAINVEEPITD